MDTTNKTQKQIDKLLSVYGAGHDGCSPTRAQWESVLARDPEQPITLMNFFKLRETAQYGPDSDLGGTGQEAFDRYASVSIPSMQAAGGKFLIVAPFEGTFVGGNKNWDLIAVGSYPDVPSLLRLFEDSDYQRVFFHRTAACADQEVLIASA